MLLIEFKVFASAQLACWLASSIGRLSAQHSGGCGCLPDRVE